MKRFLNGLIVLGLLVSLQVMAQTDSPATLLQDVSNKMIAQLEKNKAQLKQKDVIQKIVDTVLIPHVALNYMGMSVVGRFAWTNAKPDVRREFLHQFTRLVTSTYAAALASYDGDTVQVYPLRGDWQGKRTLQVRSIIIRRSGQRIPIVYNVVKTKKGWLVYDFSIENVSITRSYRAQFASTLSQSGLKGLLQRLVARNGKR